MYSYKEFPEQVTTEIQNFAKNYNFVITEKNEAHLRYENDKWSLNFICDHGETEISLVSLKDGFKYTLFDILELWFIESYYHKKMNEYIWGSLKTIKFNIEALEEHFIDFDKKYISNSDDLKTIRKRSYILINYAVKQGSKKLKNIFSLSNNEWIELASFEFMSQNAIKPNIINKIFDQIRRKRNKN